MVSGADGAAEDPSGLAGPVPVARALDSGGAFGASGLRTVASAGRGATGAVTGFASGAGNALAGAGARGGSGVTSEGKAGGGSEVGARTAAGESGSGLAAGGRLAVSGTGRADGAFAATGTLSATVCSLAKIQ